MTVIVFSLPFPSPTPDLCLFQTKTCFADRSWHHLTLSTGGIDPGLDGAPPATGDTLGLPVTPSPPPYRHPLLSWPSVSRGSAHGLAWPSGVTQ